jgi:DNA-binding NarL/FixJ family response regulator
MTPVGETVLIVDDHATFRSRARQMLESCGFRVVGEAPDGTTGISAAQALRPEVVLLDVQLPDIDGFDVADVLAREVVGTAVVLVSVREASEFGARLSVCPARGFISKSHLTGSTLAEVLAS